MQFSVGQARSGHHVDPAAAAARCRAGSTRSSRDEPGPRVADPGRPGFPPSWQINGRTFDPSYADHRPRLGTVETWRLVNATEVAHLFHLHHTDWYLLARNGKPPPPYERCLKETFFIDPGDELARSPGRFSDYAGKYVVHCHMLDHEDHGLMSQFETVAQ